MSELAGRRLILRPWSESDAESMFPLFADAETMRYWNAPPTPSLEAMRNAIRRSVGASPDVHAAWAVTAKATGAIVGFLNYHHREIADRRLELGYLIGRPFWRRGFAAEAVAAFIAHCFEAKLADRIEATVDPANLASIRLLEKLGFRQESGPAMKSSDGCALDELRFALLLPEWRAG